MGASRANSTLEPEPFLGTSLTVTANGGGLASPPAPQGRESRELQSLRNSLDTATGTCFITSVSSLFP